jgi:hypothetical protein
MYASSEWQLQPKSHFRGGTMILDALLSADVQVMFAKSEDELQLAKLQLSNIMVTYNLEILYYKRGTWPFVVNTKSYQW